MAVLSENRALYIFMCFFIIYLLFISLPFLADGLGGNRVPRDINEEQIKPASGRAIERSSTRESLGELVAQS